MSEERREVVVVTGASAGVGRAVVREFARRGASIGLLARGRDGLEGARREVEDLGGRALVLPTDTSDHDQVEAAAEAVERELGPIDVWVNNAMVSVMGTLMQITPEEFRRVSEVTYLGYVWGTMAALRRMAPRNRGHIVQVGSALAYRGLPLQAAYCGAKHAIVGFTESVRSELIHDKSAVQVSMVQLPGLNTPQFRWVRNRMPHTSRPAGDVYQPEVAARAVYQIAHSDQREMYVGYGAIKAIVGSKLAPDYLDRYLAETIFEAHQTDQPEDPDRPDNLFEPLPGDWGAHGPFDLIAKETGLCVWAKRLRIGAGLTLAALVGIAMGVAGGAGRASCRD